MTDYLTEIIELNNSYSKLQLMPIPHANTPDELDAMLERRYFTIKNIAKECNRLVENELFPVLLNFVKITDEIEERLIKFCQDLEASEAQTDYGLEFMVYDALVNRARINNDNDRLVKFVYHRATVLYRLDKNRFKSIIQESLSEIVNANKLKYRSIEKEETRLYICKSVGNLFLSKIGDVRTDWRGVLNLSNETLDFYNNPKIKEFDPHFPFRRFLYITYQNITSMLEVLREAHKGRIPELSDNPEAINELSKLVYDSANALIYQGSSMLSKEEYRHCENKIRYVYSAASFHYGKITLEKLVDMLKNLYVKSRKIDYSENGIFTGIFLPSAYGEYLSMLEGPENVSGALRGLMYNIIEFCMGVGADTSRYIVSETLVSFIAGSLVTDGEMYYNIVMSMTVHNDFTTYVHSGIVSELACLFVEKLIDINPGYLVGIYGEKNAREVRRNKADILGKVIKTALAFDIGKAGSAFSLSENMRSFLPHEKRLVMKHVDVAKEIFEHVPSLKYIYDVAYGHHKHYDNKGGYPPEFDLHASQYKNIINIIAVADSIAAGTNPYGNLNSEVKKFDEIIAEIKEGAGTRYCPLCAGLLDDAAFLEKLRYTAEQRRRLITFEIHREAEERPGMMKAVLYS